MARTKRRKTVRRHSSRGSGSQLEHLARAVIAAKSHRCRIARNHLAKARKADPSTAHSSQVYEVQGKIDRLCR